MEAADVLSMNPSSSPPAFVLFGPAHLAALLTTFIVGWALVCYARRHPGKTRPVERFLAVALALLFPASAWVGWKLQMLNRENAFPCHLCDIAALCGAAALWLRHQRLAELVWFWGLAGTLNGLITPALADSFPSPRFISFFALHGGVVVAAFFLVLGLGLRPEKGAVWRAFGWIQVYMVVALGVNGLTGANYGFLRSKPEQGSLLDALGPWPYYIFGLQFLALILFTLLDLPFRRSRRSR